MDNERQVAASLLDMANSGKLPESWAKTLREAALLLDVFADRPAYNPDFGDARICTCGHPYYRHFDSYDDQLPVGCKYCGCPTFTENPK